MIYKYCSNCGAKYEASLRQCNKCEGNNKARYKRYAVNRTDKDSQDFYRSKEWLSKRADIKDRDKGICLHCWFIKNEFNVMDMVHHIEELKECWDKRLDEENLISLCNNCHGAIHREYKEEKINKINLQNKLRMLIVKSKEDLGINDSDY